MSELDQNYPTAAMEAKELLNFYNADPTQVLPLIERQLNAIHMRAQVIIGFAAVAVTTTGFSGRLIAGTSTAAQVSIIAGLCIVLVACLWIFLRVLAVEWVISRYLKADDLLGSLGKILSYRDRKTRAYRMGCAGVLLGLSVYAIAIAIMLLNPEPLAVPVR